MQAPLDLEQTEALLSDNVPVPSSAAMFNHPVRGPNGLITIPCHLDRVVEDQMTPGAGARLRTLRVLLALIVASVAMMVAQAIHAPAEAQAQMCGTRVGKPVRIKHVIVIVMENHSYGQLIGPSTSSAARQNPFLNGVLKRRCGLATNYSGITHPSLPNYISMLSGSTGGIHTNCNACWANAPTLLRQLERRRLGWRVFAESMPDPCTRHDAGLYEKHHNPATYYRVLVPTCPRKNLPLGSLTSGHLARALRRSTLPAFTMIVPNNCHNTHDCSMRTGDDWLRLRIRSIVSSPSYVRGRTAVLLTWDEGAGGRDRLDCLAHRGNTSCHIPLFVISPYTRVGARTSVPLSHYSVLKAVERRFHLRRLGHAGSRSTRALRWCVRC